MPVTSRDAEALTSQTTELSGAAGLAAFPAAAAAANGVSLAEVIRYIQENGTDLILSQLSGAAGIASFPNGAAPANNVSLAEVLRFIHDGLFGTVGLASFPAAAAPANDVSLAEVVRKIYDQTAVGNTFWVKKTLVSSAVVQAGVDITGVSSGGELAIEDVIVKTNGTGLATATNFVICSDNANGLANILVETVANLGANKTMDLTGASVTKIRTVLETGKKLIAKSTVADCDGAGTIDVYIKFRALTAGATIAAA